MRRQSTLNIKPPKMRHGDADKLADRCERAGLSIQSWQRIFLNRLEAASMDEQFLEVVGDLPRQPLNGWHKDGYGLDHIDLT